VRLQLLQPFGSPPDPLLKFAELRRMSARQLLRTVGPHRSARFWALAPVIMSVCCLMAHQAERTVPFAAPRASPSRTRASSGFTTVTILACIGLFGSECANHGGIAGNADSSRY